jgi:hypothetical protein
MPQVRNNKAIVCVSLEFPDYLEVMKLKDPEMDQSTFLRTVILEALNI